MDPSKSNVLDYQAAGPRGLRGHVLGVFRRRAFWVLVDQGIVSGANFGTGFILGRAMPPEQFGGWTLFLETVFYVNGLQAALVNYPLTMKGATGGRDTLRRLSTASMWFTLLLLPALGLFMGVSATDALGGAKPAVLAVAAMLGWQLQETLRRALMADLRYAEAVVGDSIKYLGQLGAMFLCFRAGVLTPEAGLSITMVIIACTSAAAAIAQGFQVGVVPVRASELRLLAREYWALGRWMLLSNLTGIVNVLFFLWTLQWYHTKAAVGVFASVTILFKLANPVMASVTALIVPSVARAAHRSGMHAASRIAWRYTLFGAALLAPFFLLLVLIPGRIMLLAWGADSPYLQESHLVRLFVVNYAMIYIQWAATSWLTGLGESRQNFLAQMVNCVVTIFIGLPLTIWLGVEGVVLGGMAAVTSNAVACSYYLVKAIRRHAAFAPAVDVPEQSEHSVPPTIT